MASIPDIHINDVLTPVLDNSSSSNLSDSSNSINPAPGTDSEENPRLVSGIIVISLMFLNLLGNGLVFWVYQFNIREGIFSLFVKMLAGLDIFCALTSMIMDAIIKMIPLSKPLPVNTDVLCKLAHFQSYSNAMTGCCVLLLIAFQRYRVVKNPMEELTAGMELRTAKIILVVCSVVCTILCSPSLLIHGSTDIEILVNGRPVTTPVCRFDKDWAGSPLQKVFSFALVALGAIVLLTTVVFYFLVYRAWSRNEFNRADMVANTTNHNGQTRGQQRYGMFVVITAIFIVSYLPYFLTKSMKLGDGALDKTERFFVDLAYISPYISTVANPFVYGFCSAEFRRNCKRLFKCTLCAGPCRRTNLRADGRMDE